MTPPMFLPLPGNGKFAVGLAGLLGGEVGRIETRRFPDGETYLRLLSEVAGRDIVLVCTLDRPDTKLVSLLIAADAARELGAFSVGLVAPYLAYMRQDRRFQNGEAISSRSFARRISGAVDWLVTADPHLHRYASLGDIYDIPAEAVHAAAPISDWIRTHIERPLIIGPDSESEQWASAIARRAGAPHAVCSKLRLGDRDVRIALPDLAAHTGRTPVLVDDIASSARTLIEAARGIGEAGFPPPECVIVHPLFARGAFAALSAEAGRIVSTDAVVHSSNAISLQPVVAQGVQRLLAKLDR